MIKSYTTDNGIRVIYEKIPHFKSVTVGLWIGVGSAYEKQDENGLSHFIEHMLFKGTENRNAKQIAVEIDAIGGQINAFTAKEYTCLYCKLMDQHLSLGLDILSDMICNPLFEESEIAKEKGVILEEISMYEDTPEDLVHDMLAKNFFMEHPLASSILGSTNSIEGFSKAHLIDYFHKYYAPENMVISIAGSFDEAMLKNYIVKYFDNWNNQGTLREQEKLKEKGTAITFKEKAIEQIHMCLAFPGMNLGNEGLYSMLIMNNIFGGSMSSRLFQRVREDNGLAYTVFSYPSSYLPGGIFTIYAGMKSNQATDVLEIMVEEMELLKKRGITDDEFKMGKEQLKGNYIMGLESNSSIMTALGKNKLLLDDINTPEEVLYKINKVSMADLEDSINKVFGSAKYTAATVGDTDITDTIRMLFQ